MNPQFSFSIRENDLGKRAYTEILKISHLENQT